MIKFKFKPLIDANKAMKQFGKKSEAAMKKVGAIIMREAQKSIKQRIVTIGMLGRLAAAQGRGDQRAAKRILATINKRRSAISAPGQPPFAHVPKRPYRSIQDIRFAATEHNVIVGPAGGNQRVLVGSNRETVPQILEIGGTATIVRGRGRKKTRKRAVYRPRPFMKPALVKTFPKQKQAIEHVFTRT